MPTGLPQSNGFLGEIPESIFRVWAKGGPGGAHARNRAMRDAMDCIFCKIVAGEIPAFKVYEDGGTLAFMDINPLAEGHLLVVSKRHFANLFDGDDAAMGQAMAAAGKIARAMQGTLGIDSLNLVQANGPWAAQSVQHFHIHLIPRKEGDGLGMDWPLVPGDMDAIRQTGDAIAAAIS